MAHSLNNVLLVASYTIISNSGILSGNNKQKPSANRGMVVLRFYDIASGHPKDKTLKFTIPANATAAGKEFVKALKKCFPEHQIELQNTPTYAQAGEGMSRCEVTVTLSREAAVDILVQGWSTKPIMVPIITKNNKLISEGTPSIQYIPNTVQNDEHQVTGYYDRSGSLGSVPLFGIPVPEVFHNKADDARWTVMHFICSATEALIQPASQLPDLQLWDLTHLSNQHLQG